MKMTGRIHSFQSLGTVDGPGVRCVIFMQGCPLRCVCCHNPDTWDPAGGEETDTDTLVQKILRFRGYFGKEGGVTLSGGEPLLQSRFCIELFQKLKAEGIRTALDTSGCILNEEIRELLSVTDLILLDHKYPTEEAYRKNTLGSLEETEKFLEEANERHIPVWLRRVVIPDLTDSEDSVRQLVRTAERFPCVKRIELLPFRKLCLEKYQALGLPFPLTETPEADGKCMEKLNRLIPAAFTYGGE